MLATGIQIKPTMSQYLHDIQQGLVRFFVALSLSLVLSSSTFAANQQQKETVVLLHGLARSSAAMWMLSIRLHRAGYHVEHISYRSLNVTPDEILGDVTRQIDRCCRSLSAPVHFVGHSLGGLLIRGYLQENQVKQLGRVVLMGTPNQGTGVVDHFQDRWWAKLAGPAAMSLGTGEDSFPASLSKPDYPLGVIAGVRSLKDANAAFLPGDDDGVVPVSSTRLEGMSDFVVIETGHAMMRYNREVAHQAIMFLKQGYFDHQSLQGR